MAGFCGNCGSKLNDGDRVCGNCGMPVAEIPTDNPVLNAGPSAAPTPVKPKIGSRLIILAAAAAAVIIVAVAGFVLILGNGGYKGTVKKMVKALQNEDMEALEELASSIGEDVYGRNYLDYYEEMVDGVLDNYEDAVGSIKNISYSIEDASEVSERRVENIKENLEDYYDADVDEIEEIVMVDLVLTVKGSKRSRVCQSENLYLIKEDGEWKIHYGYLAY